MLAVSDRDQYYMNMVTTMAEAVEPVAAARIASALVYKNEVISIGINHTKTHPFQKKFGKNPQSLFWHSETHALKQALDKGMTAKQFRKSTLYIARRKKKKISDGVFEFQDGLVKPCNGCAKCIEFLGVGRTIYTTNDNNKFECL